MENKKFKIENKKFKSSIPLFLFSIPVFLFSFFFFLFPIIIFAQDQGSIIACDGVDCDFPTLIKTAQNVAGKIVLIGLTLSPIIFAYAGYLYLTSQDDPGKRTKANGIFKNVAIGIVIMMLAWVFVNLILTALVCGSVSGGNWFDVSTGCAPK